MYPQLIILVLYFGVVLVFTDPVLEDKDIVTSYVDYEKNSQFSGVINTTSPQNAVRKLLASTF